MDFVQARAYIKGLIRRGIKYELAKIQRLAQLLGNPQDKLKWIHVTGTNGKGSTSAHIEALLRAGGFTVGLFSSPHLVSILERFRVDGRDMTRSEFVSVVERLKPAIEKMKGERWGPPTFFEICTAAACLHFISRRVQVAVAEVGLGGRLDATNIVSPVLTIITNIAMDHPKTLGPTLADICREKCGIVKSGVPMLSGIVQDDLRHIVSKACRRNSAPLFEADRLFSLSGIEVSADGGTAFNIDLDGNIRRLSTPLLGEHQATNAAMALAAVGLLPAGLRVESSLWQKGLDLTRWPGRFQIVARNPTIVIDGAHNLDGIKALARTFRSVFPGKKAWMLVGFSGDKTVAGIGRVLAPLAEGFVITRSDNYRAADPADLKRIFASLTDDENGNARLVAIDDPREAVQRVVDIAGPDGIVLVTGSLYLLGNVIEGMQ